MGDSGATALEIELRLLGGGLALKTPSKLTPLSPLPPVGARPLPAGRVHLGSRLLPLGYHFVSVIYGGWGISVID